MSEQARRYVLISALALLFLGPPTVATVVYLTDMWRPGTTTNHGEMIYPPRPVDAARFSDLEGNAVSEDTFRGQWTVGYLSDGNCRGLCQERIYHIRQIRLALGNDATRVQRVLVTPYEGTDGEYLSDVLAMYPNMAALRRGEAETGVPLAEEALDNGATVQPGEIFIIDPQGNLMMRYPEGEDAMGLLEDLRKMLRASRFG